MSRKQQNNVIEIEKRRRRSKDDELVARVNSDADLAASIAWPEVGEPADYPENLEELADVAFAGIPEFVTDGFGCGTPEFRENLEAYFRMLSFTTKQASSSSTDQGSGKWRSGRITPCMARPPSLAAPQRTNGSISVHHWRRNRAGNEESTVRICDEVRRTVRTYGVRASLPVSLSRSTMAGSAFRRLGQLCRLMSLQAKRPHPSAISYLVVNQTVPSIPIK
jgi:hypothetical protein